MTYRRDVVSMSRLFPACNRVLDRELRPLHYKELMKMALELLKISPAKVDTSKLAEDIREKLPPRANNDIIYTGKPDCLMAKLHWFPRVAPPLLHDEYIVIPGNVSQGIEGAFEALMRNQYMINKIRDYERRNLVRAQGLVVEKHVTNWFKRNYPNFYREADNYRQWERACRHDFKLQVGDKSLSVDVSSDVGNGYHSHNKKPTDLHLLCEVSSNGTDVIWRDIRTKTEFDENKMAIGTGRSPRSMVVWLNCLKYKINYNQFILTQSTTE